MRRRSSESRSAALPPPRPARGRRALTHARIQRANLALIRETVRKQKAAAEQGRLAAGALGGRGRGRGRIPDLPRCRHRAARARAVVVPLRGCARGLTE